MSGVQHGTLSFSPTGAFTYTPNAGFIGTDTFTYKDYDGLEWSQVATVTIAVAENPSVAVNDAYTVSHGQTLFASYNGVLANDTDPEKDPLTASLLSNVQHGTLSFGPTGAFTYTPNAGFIGTDTFTYQDSDGIETSTVATVTIAVVENPPIANNASYSIAHDKSLSVTSGYGGLLSYDSDPDGDPLTASLVSNVLHGTLTLSANGAFTYTPNAGYSGIDTFTYKAFDGMESSTLATVTIAVTENPPVAKNDSYSISHGQTLTTTTTNGVLVNDSDPDRDSLTASLVSGVQHGTLTFNANGTFTYTPAAGFIGTDSFTYKDYDGLEFSTVATATIAVNENAPVARNDSYSISHGRTLTTTLTNGVLANDTDPDHDSLTASLVTGVQHGTLTLNANGTFTYTPNAGYVGTDFFTYKASDGTETSTIATVTIADPENPPVAKNDAYTVSHNQTLTQTASTGILANDSDHDGDSLTASLVSNVQHGSLSLSSTGAFTYTPTSGFIGTDTFTYKTYDGLEWSTVATVTIAVTESAPSASADSYVIPYGQTLTSSAKTGILANDTDSDQDTLTPSVLAGPYHGTLSLSSTGSFTYTPNAGFAGTDTFVYRDFDGILYSAPAFVAIDVGHPSIEANSDTYQVLTGQTLSVTAPGLLTNDQNTLDVPYAISLVTPPSHGTLTSLNNAGSFNYTPNAGFFGTDTFTYRDQDVWGPSGTATVSITVTSLSGSPGASINAQAGATYQGTVATFHEANASTTVNQYSAIIEWGDQTYSTGTVTLSGSTVTVAGSHAYAEPGSYAVSVQLTGALGSTATASGTATISDASMTAGSAATIDANQGLLFKGSVASFTDADTLALGPDFTASINWGDGTSATIGTVYGEGGSYAVDGSHTYTGTASTYSIVVTVHDKAGNPLTLDATADVSAAGLTVSGVSLKVLENEPVTATVAMVTLSAGTTPGTLAATINWGDGHSSPGTLTPAATPGEYAVSGTHLYAGFEPRDGHRDGDRWTGVERCGADPDYLHLVRWGWPFRHGDRRSHLPDRHHRCHRGPPLQRTGRDVPRPEPERYGRRLHRDDQLGRRDHVVWNRHQRPGQRLRRLG